MSSNDSKYAKQLHAAKAAALKAGEIIRSSQDNANVIAKSSDGVDLVTEVDHEVERVVIDMLKAEFPDDLFVGEEDQAGGNGGKQGDSFPLTDTNGIWCIDPIDGTTNFIHDYPLYAISIGYCETGGIPVVGVIYIPPLNELYEASLGCGAYCNGNPITVDKECKSIKQCLLVNNIGHHRENDFIQESCERINRWLNGGLRGYRSSGSAACNLAHVACGKLNIFYEHGYGGPWDICAGLILVQEAGGVAIDPTKPKPTTNGDGDDNSNDKPSAEIITKIKYGRGSICIGSTIQVVNDVHLIAGIPQTNFV